jgi:hypothetical protein
MFDAWNLKVAQTWDRLTPSEAAAASEARYQAATMASEAAKLGVHWASGQPIGPWMRPQLKGP